MNGGRGGGGGVVNGCTRAHVYMYTSHWWVGDHRWLCVGGAGAGGGGGGVGGGGVCVRAHSRYLSGL